MPGATPAFTRTPFRTPFVSHDRNPSGAIVRRMRRSETDIDAETGEQYTRTLTGAGIIVRPHSNSESRRAFLRFCKANGPDAVGVEFGQEAAGTYDKHTGERRKAERVCPRTGDVIRTAVAYAVIGNGPDLAALIAHPSVDTWGAAMAIRVPCIASGNGDEKVRASARSQFGRKETIAATQAVIATARATKARTELAE